jgi:RNA-splicing ligase RtcB
MERLKIYSKTVEDAAMSQIEEMSKCEAYKDCAIRIMPDCHAGKGCTIGTVIEVKDRIVPNTVGVDIGCGMYVCEIVSENIDLSRLDEVVNKYIPSGFNVHDVPVRYFSQLPSLLCKDAVKWDYIQRSVGTLGGGNHFIEVDKDSNGNYFLVIHSGSRNLGVTVCDYYQKIAEKECGIDPNERQLLINKLKSEGRQREIADAIKNLRPKVKNMTLAYLEGEFFMDYLHDMEIAQMYARINRETIAEIIFEKMGWSFAGTFHTVHNYIDTISMILRKGAVEAGMYDRLIIPMNMRDGSLLCIGKGNGDWLCSAPHGAGRLMSRKQAFDTLKMSDFEESMSDVYSTSVCPETIDESPMAYKPMQEIVDAIGDTVEILDVIKPIYNFKAKGR